MVPMGLNIKNEEVERLAAEAARRFGESKTEAIRKALLERIERDRAPSETKEARLSRWNQFLATEVWPKVKSGSLGKAVSKQDREEILGYGPDGA